MVDQKELPTLQDKPETIEETSKPEQKPVCSSEDTKCNERWISAFSDCV
jgi:hypothetical protein